VEDRRRADLGQGPHRGVFGQAHAVPGIADLNLPERRSPERKTTKIALFRPKRLWWPGIIARYFSRLRDKFVT
jgi:hypothetical protein